MKKDIHPKYYAKTNAVCNCGRSFEFGSTKETIQVEICSNCHPYYTGKSNLIDTAGRLERFKARMERSKSLKDNSVKPSKEKSKKSIKSSNQDNLKELKKELTGNQ